MTDLHSSRGTTRNGVRIDPGVEIPLDDGDSLALGEVVVALKAGPRGS